MFYISYISNIALPTLRFHAHGTRYVRAELASEEIILGHAGKERRMTAESQDVDCAGMTKTSWP